MRCKKHPTDLSSVVGVCASCLRERLFALIAAQAQAQADAEQLHNHHYHHHHHLDGAQFARAQLRETAAAEASRKSDSHAHPPPLVFPRSVSPYVSHRKSDDDVFGSHHRHHHHRFYSTPQVGPTYTSFSSAANTTGTFSTFCRKKNGSRFSFLTRFFRSRSDKLNPDPQGNGPKVCPGDSCEPSASSSPLWLSTIFSGRRKKQPPTCSWEFSGPIGRNPRRWPDRGMSPERSACSDDDCDRSQTGSGDSSECSQAWKKTPVAPTPARRGKSGHSRNVSGLAFCLSPLVRAGPSRQWNQKGGFPPDMSFSGEIRAQGKPHLSTAASFCANRSRKLVDLGKVNHNR